MKGSFSTAAKDKLRTSGLFLSSKRLWPLVYTSICSNHPTTWTVYSSTRQEMFQGRSRYKYMSLWTTTRSLWFARDCLVLNRRMPVRSKISSDTQGASWTTLPLTILCATPTSIWFTSTTYRIYSTLSFSSANWQLKRTVSLGLSSMC